MGELGSTGGDLEFLSRDGSSLGRHLSTFRREGDRWIGAAYLTGVEWSIFDKGELLVSTEQGLIPVKVQQATGGPEAHLLLLVSDTG